ncbi:hypothetical protein H4R34_003248 [Dimargaris verticillata]|uniref:DEK-C domain-containing protein n=1 Tax=Dimargaris verticillata TaxID=2761393 RepID=A0A9W8E8F5_9FUNG|nr:hypothetical protein H4R34_003248 [Dimargaris verticillata]
MDPKTLQTTCRRVLRGADFSVITAKQVRRQIEQALELDPKALDNPENKQLVLQCIEQFMTDDARSDHESSEQASTSSPPRSPEQPKTESTQRVASTDSSQETDSETETESAKPVRSSPKPTASNPLSPRTNADSATIDQESSDMSEVEDTPPAKRHRPGPKTEPGPRKPKAVAKRPETSAAGTKDETKLKSLKTYVWKCGVRKNWAKELAGLTSKQQVQRVKQILIDLGVEGRPTLDKCKKVTYRRELESERESMDTSLILDGKDNDTPRSRGLRRLQRGKQPATATLASSDPPMDFSFLGEDVE